MTAYGQPALHELRHVVRELKGGDPMTPVTILMPNNLAGLMPNNLAGIVARRFLAHGLGDAHHGVAAMFPTTATRLAEQLAAATIHPAAAPLGPSSPPPGGQLCTSMLPGSATDRWRQPAATEPIHWQPASHNMASQQSSHASKSPPHRDA